MIDGNVKNYAFSNCFEIASKAKPCEKLVFGQNQIYVRPARRGLPTRWRQPGEKIVGIGSWAWERGTRSKGKYR